MPNFIDIKVVGLTFMPGYPGNLHRVRDIAAEAWSRGEGLPCILRRNPDNPHDANAVEVHIPAMDQMIGHLPADMAARCAPHMDAGVEFSVVVWSVPIDPDHPDKPGCWIRVQRASKPAEPISSQHAA